MAYDARRDELREHRQSMPATKNRKRWCGGRAGRSHNVEVAIPPNMPGVRCHEPPDWWRRTKFGQRAMARGRDWWCRHMYRCTTCGKLLEDLPPAMCPDRPKVATS